jgi:hypothetical protein
MVILTYLAFPMTKGLTCSFSELIAIILEYPITNDQST